MKHFFRVLRWPLGQIIIFADWITRPEPPTRSPELQAKLDAETSQLKLYHFKQCPFCVKTRRSIRRLGLNIELRDARNNSQWRKQLIDQGGKYKVPSLRIENDEMEDQWIYESDAIIQYFEGLKSLK
ncbi:MAG: glutathione S-transferase N-terminal domain-containing protein [Pseudomonadota bacterium]